MKKVFLAAFPVLLFFLIAFTPNKDRNIYPKHFFGSPMDIPLLMSGTFGEPRGSHFHAGVDLKTEEVEGKNIFAAGDGYISRIRVSPYGYGKAIYITHPNGYETVYGHLSRFAEDIEAFVRDAQYRNKKFDIQLYPKKNQFPVKKGELIAYSGNTGGSGGPHLHFEIRENRGSIPLNPLFFGYADSITDNIPPIIKKIALYDREINFYEGNPIKVDVYEQNGNYTLPSDTDTLYINTHQLGLGIFTYDMAEGAANKNGVYSMELKENGKSVYYFEMDRVSFSETRYVNAHMDYKTRSISGDNFHLLFQLPGNRLSVYETSANEGVIDLSRASPPHIEIIARDYFGNTSAIDFFVKYIPDTVVKDTLPTGFSEYFSFREQNIFKDEANGLAVEFPKNTFYNDIYFDYEIKNSGAYAPVFQVHRSYVPVQNRFKLYIKPSRLPDRLKEKALIVLMDENENISSKGGSWDHGYLVASLRELGDFTIAVDTVPPKITPVNITAGKNMSNLSSIKVKISDDLSGIDSYNGYIDNEWVLMEYDYKTNLLTYSFDDRIGKGEHTFTLRVSDERENVSNLNLKFRR